MASFTPPTTQEYSDDFFFGRYGVTVGISVLLRDGHYAQVPYPWLGEIADLTEGETWFQGGRTYADISEDVAAALTADGFTVT